MSFNRSDLDPKEHCFALEYLKDFNIARAAADSGIATRDFYTIGYRMLQRQAVRDVIAMEIAKRDKVVAADSLFVIQRLVDVLEADLVQWGLSGKEGLSEEKLQEMPAHIRKLVTSIEREETYSHATNETTTTFKIKFMDKTKCLELLGKYLGLFDKRLKVDMNVNHSFTDWAEEMRRKREREIIEVAQKDIHGRDKGR